MVMSLEPSSINATHTLSITSYMTAPFTMLFYPVMPLIVICSFCLFLLLLFSSHDWNRMIGEITHTLLWSQCSVGRWPTKAVQNERQPRNTATIRPETLINDRESERLLREGVAA